MRKLINKAINRAADEASGPRRIRVHAQLGCAQMGLGRCTYERKRSGDERINQWFTRLVRRRKMNEERSQWRMYQDAFCLLSNRLWGNGQNYADAGFLRNLEKFNNLCSVSMATVGLVRAVQSLCSLRQSLQGSLFAVCHVYIKRPRHSQRQTYGSLYPGPHSYEESCKRKFHMPLQFLCVLSSGRAGTNDRLYGSTP